ncbi:hypothetical protein HY490_01325 [Candidatus Woesearchaeota archaeon]|nr:hypothetical protein [Candidatus Woesearchaeota archaeon]
MKLVADTGALISLSCSQHKELVFKEHTIFITKSVLKELQDFAIHDDLLGTKAKELIRRKFIVKDARETTDLGLGRAESEIFSCAKDERLIAITDDAHASRIAEEKLQLTTKPSFYLLLFLYKKWHLTKEALTQDIKSVLRQRNWLTGALWEYALELIDKL